MRALEITELILFSIFSVCLSTEPIGKLSNSITADSDPTVVLKYDAPILHVSHQYNLV